MVTFQLILVPTDFGEASARVLELALAMAERFGSKVTLLHAYELPIVYSEGIYWPTEPIELEAKRALDAALAAAKTRCPRVDAVLRRGPAWEQTLEVVRDRGADLIVMGTHGRRGVSRALIGSQAERVVRLSPVPVLTVSEGGKRRAHPRPSGVAADAPTA